MAHRLEVIDFKSVFILRHVLTIPRKVSIVDPCVALHCLFAFYLASFAYSFSRIVHYAPSRSKQNLLS